MNEKILLAISPSIIAAIATYYVASKNIFSTMRTKVANAQLYNVYLPLFTFLEPYLYKNVDIDIIKEFLQLFDEIKDNHYELIHCDLLNDVQILKNSLKNNTYKYEYYDYVCNTLDRHFEKNRRFLKLPTRTLEYKINNRQFNKSTRETLRLIGDRALELLPFILLILCFTVLATLVQIFINFISNL